MSDPRGVGQPRAYDWRDDALCRQPQAEQFFPAGETGVFLEQAEDAKEFCRSCPVAMPCAQWAVRKRVWTGVWGGVDEIQRRRIFRNHTLDELTDDRVEQLIRTVWAADSADRLLDAYLARTEQDDDGHVVWTIASTSITVGTRVLTAAQLAFEIGYGRAPDGHVKAVCGRPNCVAAEHVADQRMRAQRDHARAA